jgi:small subunit ribosomal protein S1
MNQEEKKVGLSIKAIGEEATRAEVENYKESSNKGKGGNKGQGSGNSSSSSANAGSTTLGDLLKWKQSENEDNDAE